MVLLGCIEATIKIILMIKVHEQIFILQYIIVFN